MKLKYLYILSFCDGPAPVIGVKPRPLTHEARPLGPETAAGELVSDVECQKERPPLPFGLLCSPDGLGAQDAAPLQRALHEPFRQCLAVLVKDKGPVPPPAQAPASRSGRPGQLRFRLRNELFRFFTWDKYVFFAIWHSHTVSLRRPSNRSTRSLSRRTCVIISSDCYKYRSPRSPPPSHPLTHMTRWAFQKMFKIFSGGMAKSQAAAVRRIVQSTRAIPHAPPRRGWS